MAPHHGGRTQPPAPQPPPPRAHRPRAPIMSVPPPITAPLPPLRPNNANISSGNATTTTTALSSVTTGPVHHHHHPHLHHPSPTSTLPPPLAQSPRVVGVFSAAAAGGTSPNILSAAAAASVSLAAPRPDNERVGNEYVETPFRPQPPPVIRTAAPTTTTSTATTTLSTAAARPARLPVPVPASQQATPPVTKQPGGGGTPFVTKESAAAAQSIATSASPECAARQPVFCTECGHCRCAACAQPRRLPERWLCGNKCLCSADACVDYASCLCCVKGVFYHCAGDDAGAARCASEPCGCGPERRAARWGCLAAIALPLPCLWLYWPLRCGQRAAEACWARRARTGCRCGSSSRSSQPAAQSHDAQAAGAQLAAQAHRNHGGAGASTPEKRLLDSPSLDF